MDTTLICYSLFILGLLPVYFIGYRLSCLGEKDAREISD